MPTPTPAQAGSAPLARTHAEAAELFRRPFAPGAIGFRAMSKVAYDGKPYAGAQVAAYLNAQSVLHRLNAVVPGRWRQRFTAPPTQLAPGNDGRAVKRLYLACRLTVTLPLRDGGDDVDAVYEDIGELDAGAFAGLKALYSDARKRAAVAAGIGAYLYTALAPVVLPVGPGARHVHAVRRPGKPDLLTLTPQTEQWLRDGYRARILSPAVTRDLGPILPHGEPEAGMGQGEHTEAAGGAPAATEPDPGRPGDGGANGTDTLVAGDASRVGRMR